MANEQAPKLTKDEAQDLGTRLTEFGKDLSPKQKSFLRYAVNSVARESNNQADVQGYDYYEAWDTGYYDGYTGLEIYRVDFYDNYGDYEGSEYVED